ncbi:DUF5610 domain-containing protein [Marinobacter sp. CHS3-4]|uniref:DUF5610 domain-containing protein n=1 Tax=Marinobacter sp. CHS3-4 TaxID=3045174 RepID=UPI0024B4C752|nr:DUF5610 domain-containing protein [Marinobacter sp. CHS3-4]MDI9244765.1 DUF5610 domain-containing protein [Marinobacter sp. CHS3-4]
MVSPVIISGNAQSGRSPVVADSLSGSVPNAIGPAGQGTPENNKVSEAARAPIRTAEDAINVLKARLAQRLEQQLGKAPAQGASRFTPSTFEAPSAEQVAQRVLGFVQQRLQAEASSGADTERLAGLLSDARAGVTQGFAEAREQIEAIGMMDEQLNADIDDSFNRIQAGLDDLESQFVQPAENQSSVESVGASGYRLERASESLFSFEVTTEEGDRVTVQMAEQRYAGSTVESRQNELGQSLSMSFESGFSGRYSFSVEGDLNAGERKALADLFSRVEKVSNRFFDGDIQGAFRKAKSLGLGGEELASFSLSLTSTRIVSAAAYESISQQPSANAELRPLGNLARDLRGVAQSAFERGASEPAFKGLMNALLEDIRQWQVERADIAERGDETLMNDFMSAVIRSLNPKQDSQLQV